MAEVLDYRKLLNKVECFEILQKVMGDDHKLCMSEFEYEIIPVSTDVKGFLGEYYYLKIVHKKKKFLKGRLLQFFVKVLPITNDLNRKLVDSLKIFPKEVRFYTEVFKEMEKYTSGNWHPKCYYTRLDLLVFDNLTNFDFRNMNENEKFTEFHLQATLKCMSQMHCSSIVLEEKSGCNIGKKYEKSLYEISLEDSTGWFRGGLKALQAVASKMPKYQGVLLNDILPDPFNFDMLYEFTNESTKYRNTFTHRDIWSKNILFRYDGNNNLPKEAILVDFQNCRYCPPAVDFMLFLILNQSSDDIKKNFIWCTKFYFESLKMELKKYDIEIESIFSYDEFVESCHYVKLLPYVFKGIYTPFTCPPDKDYWVNLQKNNPVLYNQYLEEDRSDCVIRFVEESYEFRKQFHEVIDDIVNCYCEYKQNLLDNKISI